MLQGAPDGIKVSMMPDWYSVSMVWYLVPMGWSVWWNTTN